MALACDLRFAAPDAFFFLPEIRFGILPDTGGTQLLTSLIGPSRTKYLVMTGERIDARRALEWGVVDFVVEPEDLDARALDVARKIAAGPPLAIAMARQLVDQAWAEPVRRGIRQELLAQTVLFSSEDYQEARAARREGREPRYTGR
jgi:enoyl-CoA hydratase